MQLLDDGEEGADGKSKVKSKDAKKEEKKNKDKDKSKSTPTFGKQKGKRRKTLLEDLSEIASVAGEAVADM